MCSQHRNYWSDCLLSGIEIKARTFDKNNFHSAPAHIPPYFWNDFEEAATAFPTHRGYSEAKDLIGNGLVSDIKNLASQASNILSQMFSNPAIDVLDPKSTLPPSQEPRLVKLKLSTNLMKWKETQRELGNILPAKKNGLIEASREVLDTLGASDWPEVLRTNNALFGSGMANLLIGAADAPTMFSNYVTDMVFYYEHGYDSVFPTLGLLVARGLADPYARRTLGGYERRVGVCIGREYIQGKIKLEKRHKSSLTYSSARLGRREAQIVSLLESSLMGMAAEVISRGYDAGAVMSDLVFSSPGTDVVDVGSDLLNSEVMNAFLNVADITNTGIVSEHALRRIYDAYAATGARMFTERWHESMARMNATLYTWHMQNDRHMFLRRAILGWPKARKMATLPQREADFDEAFDQRYHTTGFWRPLKPEYQCDGRDTCDRVEEFLDRNDRDGQLRDLWWCLMLGPLAYVRAGRVDEPQEEALVERSRLQMARVFTQGLVLEMAWLIAHVNFHAWQVNYMFEAAMFGSILDCGELIGKLDRIEGHEK